MIDFAKLEQTRQGFVIRRDEKYVIEVWRMTFNWRLVVMLPNQTSTVEHGYCYFGTGLEALTRAVAAGLEWDDPLHTDPTGFDKKAF